MTEQSDRLEQSVFRVPWGYSYDGPDMDSSSGYGDHERCFRREYQLVEAKDAGDAEKKVRQWAKKRHSNAVVGAAIEAKDRRTGRLL